jgi:hypothetical protein
MKSGERVWMVADGTYSDWHVEGLFSTEEKAQEYVKEICPSGDVTEEPLDEFDRHVALARRGYKGWAVRIKRDGDVDRVDQQYTMLAPSSNGHAIWIDNEVMHVKLIARSEEGAVKIAGEKRRQAVAEGWWKNGYKEWDSGEGVAWEEMEDAT